VIVLRTLKDTLEGLFRRINLCVDIEGEFSVRNDSLYFTIISIIVHNVLDEVLEDGIVVEVNGGVGACYGFNILVTFLVDLGDLGGAILKNL
jgi:hypothetical protein